MPRVGDIIGEKYRLEALLGRGGMGSVFEASHLEIRKKVAIKILSQHTLSGNLAARFHREAKVAASVDHPGIVDVYDIGLCPKGEPYFVMELLEGQTLGELLDRERTLTVSLACYILVQVLSGIKVVHETGIIHRDLKPNNVFLADFGRAAPEVKLIDFGISKLTQNIDKSGPLTAQGTFIGTPAYMSPEQVKGNSVIDHRADLYSLGVILYECLTGGPPFGGLTTEEIASNILSQPLIEPRKINPDIPEDLNTIITSSLQRDPDARYQTASEMITDLIPFLRQDLLPHLIECDDELSVQPTIQDKTIKDKTIEEQPPPLDQSTVDEGPSTQSLVLLVNKSFLRSPFFLVCCGVLLIGLLVGVFSWISPQDQTQPDVFVEEVSETPEIASDPPDEIPPEPDLIKIRIRVVPKKATIFIDERRKSKNPFAGWFRKDTEVHTIRASARGYKERVETISFDRNQQLDITLEGIKRLAPTQKNQQKHPEPWGDDDGETSQKRTGPWRDEL